MSNATARQRAAKFMELGDGYFAQSNYVLAYDRYKSAVQATPDLVEPYLRRGQALIAMQSYDLASTRTCTPSSCTRRGPRRTSGSTRSTATASGKRKTTLTLWPPRPSASRRPS